MPTYPGSPTLTVDAMLRRPAFLARALATLTSKRFIADLIFASGTPEMVAGGAAWYQRSESIYPDRGAEEVGVRSEFPRTGWSEAVLTAIVRKYGLEAPIAFEAIRRNQIDQVQRAQRKLSNAVVKFVDTQAMSLLTTDAAVLSQAAAGNWTSAATTIVSDIVNARKLVTDQDEGYEVDTLIVNPAQELAFLTNANLLSLLPRENQGANPLNNGRAVPIMGLRQILVTPQLAAGTAIMLQANVVGTIADEAPDAGEGYVTYDTGGRDGAGANVAGANLSGPFANPANPNVDRPPVYTKVYNVDGRDEKIIRIARFPAMWLSEPKAAVKITGV
jgi:hypothetical protein